MMRTKRWMLVLGVLVSVAGIGPGTREATAGPFLPDFGSATFGADSATLANPLFPLSNYLQYVYEGEKDEKDEKGETVLEQTVVDVTPDTKTILGVECRVVRDRVYEVDEEAVLMEDTDDWFAQDTDGNVWYMGEYTTEYEYNEDGDVIGESHEGSWEAGVDGALPGYIMEAIPQVGDSYYQEYYVGEAEDEAEVTSLAENVSVPYGSFTGCLQTFETTALEPDVREYKYYASGLGLVLEEELDENFDVIYRSELVSVEVPEPGMMVLLAVLALSLPKRGRLVVMRRKRE